MCLTKNTFYIYFYMILKLIDLKECTNIVHIKYYNHIKNSIMGSKN
jgi:hypothetical protein